MAQSMANVTPSVCSYKLPAFLKEPSGPQVYCPSVWLPVRSNGLTKRSVTGLLKASGAAVSTQEPHAQ